MKSKKLVALLTTLCMLIGMTATFPTTTVAANIPVFTNKDFALSATDIVSKFVPNGTNKITLSGGAAFLNTTGANSRQYTYNLASPLSKSNYSYAVIKMKNTSLTSPTGALFRLHTGMDQANMVTYKFYPLANETGHTTYVLDLSTGTNTGSPTNVVNRIDLFPAVVGAEAYVEYIRLVSSTAVPTFTDHDFTLEAQDIVNSFKPVNTNTVALVGGVAHFSTVTASRQYTYNLPSPIYMSAYNYAVLKIKNIGIAGRGGLFRLHTGTNEANLTTYRFSPLANEEQYTTYVFNLSLDGTKTGSPTNVINRIDFFPTDTNAECNVEYMRLISSMQEWRFLLGSALDSYNGLIENDYTPASWAAFSTARSAIETLLASVTEPSSAAVDAAIVNLQAAVGDLTENVQITPPTLPVIPEYKYQTAFDANFTTCASSDDAKALLAEGDHWAITRHGTFTDINAVSWSAANGIYRFGDWTTFEGLTSSSNLKNYRLTAKMSVSPIEWSGIGLRGAPSEAVAMGYTTTGINADSRLMGPYNSITKGITLQLTSQSSGHVLLGFRTASATTDNIVMDLESYTTSYFTSDKEIVINDNDNVITISADGAMILAIIMDENTRDFVTGNYTSGSVYIYENNKVKYLKTFEGANIPESGVAGFYQRNGVYYIKTLKLQQFRAPIKVGLYDANENEVFNLTNTNADTFVKAVVDSEMGSNIKILAASYFNDKLIKAQSLVKTEDGNYNTYKTKLELSGDADCIKVFVWNDDLKPYITNVYYHTMGISLQNKINECNNLLSSAAVGTETGQYTQADYDKFYDAIAKASLALAQRKLNEIEVNFYINNLEAAMVEFSESKIENFDFTVVQNQSAASIYMPDDVDTSIAYTVNDFKSDCQKATNLTPEITTVLDISQNMIIPITIDSEEYQQLYSLGRVDGEYIRDKFDAYKFFKVENSLVVLGNNARGVTYGLYTISEEALGIDPLYLWTDKEPGHKDEAIFSSSMAASIPSFKYRGFFINDENYLLYWKNTQTNVEPEVYRDIIETMLRLKGNMFSVTSYPDVYPSIDWDTVNYMKERDVFITGSHIDILLAQPRLDYNSWCIATYGKKYEYNYTTNSNIIQEYWRFTVRNYKDNPTVWPVGLRAVDDRDYTDSYFATLSIKEQAAFVSDAIAAQAQILKEELGTDDFVTAYTVRGAQYNFYINGLVLPENTILVWQDNGSTSIMEDLPNADDKQAHNGIYYHLTYCDNQWVQWVSAEIIRQEIKKSYNAGANEYVLYNVGDMREIPLSMYVGMDAVWNTKEWIYDENKPSDMVRKWVSFQFGEQKADEITEVYNQYYALERDMRSMSVHETIYQIIKQAINTTQSASWFNAQTFITTGRLGVSPAKMTQKRAAWTELYNKAYAVYNQMSEGEGKQFFYDNMLLQIITSKEINEWGYQTYTAFKAVGTGDKQAAAAAFELSAVSVEAIEAARVPAMHDKWENWFRGDTSGIWTDNIWALSTVRLANYARTLSQTYAN